MAIPPIRFIIESEGSEELAQAFAAIRAAQQSVDDSAEGLSASLQQVAASEAEAADEARSLGGALARTARDEQRAARESSGLERALSAQISGWGTLGTAVGQVGAVLGRVAPEFSQFGAVLGQTGQSIQAVVTALASPNPASITSALISVSATVVDAIGAWDNYQRATSPVPGRLRAIATAAKEAADELRGVSAALERQRRQGAIREGTASASDIQAERDAVEAEVRRQQAQLTVIERQAERGRIIAEAFGLEADTAQRDAVEARLDASESQATLLSLLQATREAEAANADQARSEASRSRGGGRGRAGDRRREQEAAFRELLDGVIEFADQEIAAEEARATQIAQTRADLQRTLNEIDASNLERTKANARRRIEILEDEADRTAEVRRTAIERERQLAELNEGGQFIPQSQVDRLLADYDRIEARRQELTQALIAARSVEEADAVQRQIRANEREVDAAEFRQSQLERLTEEARARSEEIEATSAGILQPVLSGITSAIADVISGARSAEEAFQALLSSFLQSIAERAAVEAAAEYAAAIGAFARYDYASGGQHLAAGVAWTGVAIAAGVGAAVTAPAEASATAPADPGGFGGGSGDGGGTVVVNFSGPVVTASTEAELGDNINRLIGQSNARAA